MYAIKTRSGGVFLKMKAMNGALWRARRDVRKPSVVAVCASARPTERAPPAGDLSAFEKSENSQFQKARRPRRRLSTP